ncbi:unnamed protein product [Anisakis simplex]|uniref:PRKCSH_1 domain-containing protein n=1 Tax=Anisakis simplex TaxID=6269 RepID=A0A0M3JDE0_ANISI|nr:unnamed protein product [Anisakis simplex]
MITSNELLSSDDRVDESGDCSSVSRGQLQMGLRYSKEDSKLLKDVISPDVCIGFEEQSFVCRNLRPLDKNGSADPYTSVKLVCVDGSQPPQKQICFHTIIQSFLAMRIINYFAYVVCKNHVRNLHFSSEIPFF